MTWVWKVIAAATPESDGLDLDYAIVAGSAVSVVVGGLWLLLADHEGAGIGTWILAAAAVVLGAVFVGMLALGLMGLNDYATTKAWEAEGSGTGAGGPEADQAAGRDA